MLWNMALVKYKCTFFLFLLLWYIKLLIKQKYKGIYVWNCDKDWMWVLSVRKAHSLKADSLHSVPWILSIISYYQINIVNLKKLIQFDQKDALSDFCCLYLFNFSNRLHIVSNSCFLSPINVRNRQFIVYIISSSTNIL